MKCGDNGGENREVEFCFQFISASVHNFFNSMEKQETITLSAIFIH